MNKYQASFIFLVGILFGLGTSLTGVALILEKQGVTVSIQQSKPQGN